MGNTVPHVVVEASFDVEETRSVGFPEERFALRLVHGNDSEWELLVDGVRLVLLGGHPRRALGHVSARHQVGGTLDQVAQLGQTVGAQHVELLHVLDVVEAEQE